MKRRFIVLIDFFEHSARLLSFSYKWAIQAGAQFLVVHHSDELLPAMGDSSILAEMRRSNELQSLTRLKDFADELIGTDPRIQFHAASYDPATSVLGLGEEGITDYLFVGMNDKSLMESFFAKSTAVRLSEETNSIIIAFPTSRYDFNFDKFYFGIKQSTPVKSDEFQDLLAIRQNMATHINFFCVLKPGSDRKRSEAYLKDISDKYKSQVETSYEIVEEVDTISAIKEYMKVNNGVLVVQKGSRSLIDMFRRFFTNEIIHHAEIPVIILP